MVKFFFIFAGTWQVIHSYPHKHSSSIKTVSEKHTDIKLVSMVCEFIVCFVVICDR